jgi:transmembrane sensor
MDLINHSVKDFMLNESFQKWILDPDEGVTVFWEEWLAAYPDKAELVREATSLILSLKEAHEKDLKPESNEVWNMITASIPDIEGDLSMKMKEMNLNK